MLAHRLRGLTPDHPVLRGSAQNPDTFFQAREACNLFYDAVPGIVEEVFDELAERTGRAYDLVEYEGAPDAERVVVVMGSGVGAVAGDRRGAEPARREGRPGQGAAVPAVPGRGSSLAALPATVTARSPSSTGSRSRARRPSRCTSTC